MKDMKTIDNRFLLNTAIEVMKKSCTEIASDAKELLLQASKKERSPAAKRLLEMMVKNAELASTEGKPVCQSPGYPVAYITLGDRVSINANFQKVLGEAIVIATNDGYLRPSMVDPITRVNSGDNSGIGVPDIEIEHVPDADYVDLVVSFKGCGAELANVTKVLTPFQVGENGLGVKKLVLETVANAGGIPCPPVAIGVGIGGQIHYAAKLSRRAIGLRKWTDKNVDPDVAEMENELLRLVNQLGIGPAGIGGDTTALAVKVEKVHTHTAICPVAINFHCWPARRAGVRIHSDKTVEQLF